jgi:nitrous-oxide reductase
VARDSPGPCRDAAVPLREFAERYHGVITAISVNQETGEMEVAWQIKTPPFHWDLSSTGKGPSSGWLFITSYNTEMAYERLEVGASQHERDVAAFVNWRRAAEAVAAGQYEVIDGVRVIDPGAVAGVMYYVPLAKSPHGIDVDPTGQWIVGGGKLEPSATVFSFEKFLKAVEARRFRGRDAWRAGRAPRCRGRRHGAGGSGPAAHAVRRAGSWLHDAVHRLEGCQVPAAAVDRRGEGGSRAGRGRPDRVHTNPGHLVIGGSDTREPYGDWLVSMNKDAAGRHLPTGPQIPETSQLIDITGERMAMVYEAFTDKEPHFAQVIRADKIDPVGFYRRAENTHPHQAWSETDTSVSRNGNVVDVVMRVVRSNFTPDTSNSARATPFASTSPTSSRRSA